MRPFALLLLMLAAAPAARAQELPRVAVLGIAPGEGVSPKSAALVEELLMNALHRTGAFRLLGRSDVASLVGFERQKQMLGCTDETCAAELAGTLGVSWVLAANLGRLGSLTVLSVKVIDGRKARVAVRADASVADESELPAALDRLARDVAGQCAREGCAASSSPIAAAPATTFGAGPTSALATAAPAPQGGAAEQYELKHLWWEDVAHAAQQQGVVTVQAILYQGKYKRKVGDREFLEILGRADLLKQFDENSAARRGWYIATGAVMAAGAVGMAAGMSGVGCAGDEHYCDSALRETLLWGGLALLLAAPLTMPCVGMYRNPYPIDLVEQRRLSDEYNRELRRSLGLEARASRRAPEPRIVARLLPGGIAGTF